MSSDKKCMYEYEVKTLNSNNKMYIGTILVKEIRTKLKLKIILIRNYKINYNYPRFILSNF